MIFFSTRSYSYVNRPPTKEEIKECYPRLSSLVEEVKYDGIVYLGNETQVFKVRKIPTLSLRNPGAILKREYKLYDIKSFAHKLDTYVSSNFTTK